MDKRITTTAIATSNATSSGSNSAASSSSSGGVVENVVVNAAGREGVVWNLGNVMDKVTSFYASWMLSPWTSFCASALTASLVWYGFHRASSL
eukprot:3966051-Ditylum_brightwellii.AAC.1